MPALIISYIVVIALCIWGQILNVFDLLTGYASMAGGELILRIVGLFIAPIGIFMGWF